MAQNASITGKVTSKETKSPVQRASVFLSNSSFGTISLADGTFALYKLRPGQYTLVVTAVGFEDFTKKIQVDDESVTVNVELSPKTIQLREVTISTTAKADWKRNFEQFKKDFLGTDENAKLCQILNPDVLYFTYHKRQLTLEAETDNFLVIDNRGLGYRVKFLLKDFKSDAISGVITYGGERLFEDLPGSAAQKKIWQKNRDIAYYGSPMHFYRSLYTDKLAEDGFEMRRLTRYPNPDRPSDQIIHQKINRFKSINRGDSVNHWIEIANLSKYTQERVTQIPWYSYEVLRKTGQQGIYAITFPNYLYVMYTKKRDETNYKDIFRPLDMPNYEISVVTLYNNPPYALFDKNGIVISGEPLYEGTWSKARLSELLPVDYVPSEKR
ncbi:carboxypeptidase-like regulatory domain-containing protein [Mucilaginibacter sp. UR6-11]|uniref:carboxypeptidase-like regulatory domain-containing protein n=1 Tax=Mucilaginibacter sp. UR6-11 TaxID=1435644 RepID=UPI001E45C20A|nr:carboxypeptidase-like regulatory domain-containing protein [Mucilaginibacter sp. UR6-11]MCC8423335.1 carboxypeptidase-like regulatory domain-containing protein [Mucilaginibacter sp. UR6-11]